MTARLWSLLFNPKLKNITSRPLEASRDSECFDFWVVHERVNQSFVAVWLPNGLSHAHHVAAHFCLRLLQAWLEALLLQIRPYSIFSSEIHWQFELCLITSPNRTAGKHAGIDAHIHLVVPGRRPQNTGITG